MSTPDSDEEMVRLRAEFPGHRISTETIMDRVRFVARSQQDGAHPHTVVTHDFGELRVALACIFRDLGWLA